jgi:adenine deaminase
MLRSGKLVDIHKNLIYPAVVHFENGIIESIKETETAEEFYILPGLIDSHIHIESSMVTPGAFSREAVKHGTTYVVSDPHEIANVMGLAGVNFMIEDSRKVPLKFAFGAPSCVPATSYESSGATIDTAAIEELLMRKDIKYLSEMMNFPGVIFNDPAVMSKIGISKKFNKPIDGHAPGLSGKELKKYIDSGISTDHECSSMNEALEKISQGMKVLIREGSAARNLDSLKELFNISPAMIMLCSDDLHPEMLINGHINKIVARLVSEGYDLFDVIRSCTLNPLLHYGLEAGVLRTGDPADFIIVDDLKTMNVIETWINGRKVFDHGNVLFEYEGSETINKFNCSEIGEQDIEVLRAGNKMLVIEAFDGELLTRKLIINVPDNRIVSTDPAKDILKIVVKDRYNNTPPSTGFIKGFGLKSGAFASSVAHDSHNIIAVGTSDRDITAAINNIVRNTGGLSVSNEGNVSSLQLKVAGIMSDRPCSEIAEKYEALSSVIKSLGCRLGAPFMTLSFMALLVIPELKIGDRGLFDVIKFSPVSLFQE